MKVYRDPTKRYHPSDEHISPIVIADTCQRRNHWKHDGIFHFGFICLHMANMALPFSLRGESSLCLEQGHLLESVVCRVLGTQISSPFLVCTRSGCYATHGWGGLSGGGGKQELVFSDAAFLKPKNTNYMI